MDNGGVYNNSNPVDEVFRDFKGRRAAVIKALTVDVDVFRRMCDPEKENLCLYGHPNGQWEVTLPAEEVPPELPEPVLGINFSRDGMQERDWLSLIAVHSDSWLLSVTSFFGARFAFNKADRLRLFNMMNELPTVLEVVNGEAERLAKRNSSSRSKTKARMVSEPPTKYYTWRKPREEDEEEEDDEDMEEEEEEEEDEDEEEQGTAVCGACGDTGTPGEFWILCDVCEVWFHGKCVRITPARAQHIKHYKCPNCSGNKKTRV